MNKIDGAWESTEGAEQGLGIKWGAANGRLEWLHSAPITCCLYISSAFASTSRLSNNNTFVRASLLSIAYEILFTVSFTFVWRFSLADINLVL